MNHYLNSCLQFKFEAQLIYIDTRVGDQLVATFFFLGKIDISWLSMKLYKWRRWCYVLLDVWIMWIKKSKWQQCARFLYYLSEITTLTSNLKNTVFVRTHRPSNLQNSPQNVQSSLPAMRKALNTASFTMCEFWHPMIHSCSNAFCTALDLQLSLYRPLVITVELTALYCRVYVLKCHTRPS